MSVVYIIDFGLAKKYRDPRSHAHISYREGKNLTGESCALLPLRVGASTSHKFGSGVEFVLA